VGVVRGFDNELYFPQLAAALISDILLVRGVASLGAEQLSGISVGLELDSHRPHVATIANHIF
jgi:hypothetical protein